MVVENTSVITKDDAFNALYRATKSNLNKKYYLGVFGILAGGAILAYGITVPSAQWISMGGIIIAVGIAYIIYNLVNIIQSPKNIKKKNPDICENGITYQYKFREHGVDLVCISETKKKKVTYEYTSFKKVYEFEDKYEIHLDTSEIMYVLKSGFQNERMISFFIKNLGTNKKLKIVKKYK